MCLRRCDCASFDLSNRGCRVSRQSKLSLNSARAEATRVKEIASLSRLLTCRIFEHLTSWFVHDCEARSGGRDLAGSGEGFGIGKGEIVYFGPVVVRGTP
jgi:hypothetical protein